MSEELSIPELVRRTVELHAAQASHAAALYDARAGDHPVLSAAARTLRRRRDRAGAEAEAWGRIEAFLREDDNEPAIPKIPGPRKPCGTLMPPGSWCTLHEGHDGGCQ